MTANSRDKVESEIQHNRFYLCDVGDAEEAFLVCGECLETNERDHSMYDELPPLPESALDDRHTRKCLVCERESMEVRGLVA